MVYISHGPSPTLFSNSIYDLCTLYIKHFPFTVFDKGGKPYIRVTYRGEEKEFVSSFRPN